MMCSISETIISSISLHCSIFQCINELIQLHEDNLKLKKPYFPCYCILLNRYNRSQNPKEEGSSTTKKCHQISSLGGRPRHNNYTFFNTKLNETRFGALIWHLTSTGTLYLYVVRLILNMAIGRARTVSTINLSSLSVLARQRFFLYVDTHTSHTHYVRFSFPAHFWCCRVS